MTPTVLANGYTFYAFKMTDGLIGSGTKGPRFRVTTGSLRLEIGFAAPQNTKIKLIILFQNLGMLEFNVYKNFVVS